MTTMEILMKQHMKLTEWMFCFEQIIKAFDLSTYDGMDYGIQEVLCIVARCTLDQIRMMLTQRVFSVMCINGMSLNDSFIALCFIAPMKEGS